MLSGAFVVHPRRLIEHRMSTGDVAHTAMHPHGAHGNATSAVHRNIEAEAPTGIVAFLGLAHFREGKSGIRSSLGQEMASSFGIGTVIGCTMGFLVGCSLTGYD